MGFLGGLVAALIGAAVVALTAFSITMYIRIGQVDRQIGEIDRQVQEDAGTMTAVKIATEKKIEEFDRALQVEVRERMKEIDEVIETMNKIAEDIGRLDAQTSQDHRDLVDIRSRYILYREPAQEEQTDVND